MNDRDQMDELLSRLPIENPPAGLVFKIQMQVSIQSQREARIRLVISLILAGAGIWLCLPALAAWFSSLSVPESGLPLVASLIDSLGRGFNLWETEMLASLNAFRSGLHAGLETSALIGLFILALGALLGLGSLLSSGEHGRS